jgi:hypothetical protein
VKGEVNGVGNSNKSQKQDPLVIFLHVQKTGGSTILDIMENQYPDEQLLLWGNHRRGTKKLTKDLKAKLKCTHHAHAPFGIHLAYPKRPFIYFTMFRDPVDRVLSQYYYIQEHRIHPLHRRIKQMSLEQFLSDQHHVSRRLTRNLQTQMASGSIEPENASLKQAKKNLKKYFAVVGVTEMFDESLFLMTKTFDWKNVSYQKKNITKKRPSKEEVPTHIIEKIKKMNQLDIALYNWVKKELQKRLKQLDPQELKEMQEFINHLNIS